jgi:hypothetical protein
LVLEKELIVDLASFVGQSIPSVVALSVVAEGNVISGERDRYLLHAQAGQHMTVRISPHDGDSSPVFQIFTPGLAHTVEGAGEKDDATEWSGELSKGGDYTIVVGGTRGNASYSLEAAIE